MSIGHQVNNGTNKLVLYHLQNQVSCMLTKLWKSHMTIKLLRAVSYIDIFHYRANIGNYADATLVAKETSTVFT